MKKRPFALLEILIALSLIALCAVPLIRQPIKNHQGEMEQIKRVEGSRIATLTFVEIKEKFLKNEFRWAQIPALKIKTSPFSLPEASTPLFPITRKYTLETLKEKHEKDGRIYRLLAIHLDIGGHPYTYRLTVYKDPSV